MYEVRDITVRRAGKALLSHVSITLAPGQVIVVVGPNGAGKSTLLKVLAGEMAPDEGTVLLDGAPLKTLPPAVLARRRAVLPQQTDVAFPFSVAEVVGLGLMGGKAALPLIEGLLERVDLSGFAARRFDSLSGGERQRTHLARVLAQLETGAGDAPRFLLLDEPTASLDLAHQLLVLRIARDHVRRGGGVFAVLHDLNLAAMAADHLVVLKHGRLLFQGTPEEVLTDTTLSEAFDVRTRVNAVPSGPFVLPQTVHDAAART
ncbi:heme ABC transporter ATP-binding protein [Aquabacter sp. CN5-332]|uniref:heme ABC transporter ATP-binding protein n=1 Tax=Aquabacter sp. CN5-332 TaxID=3156608 RepID=UPI0032B542CD